MSKPADTTPMGKDKLEETIESAASLLKAGRNGQAVHVLQAWHLRAREPDPRIDYLLGVAAFRAGDLHTAEVALRRCLAATPSDADAQYGLGTALAAKGDAAGARDAFAAALRANPGLDAARGQLQRLDTERQAATPATRKPPGIFPAAAPPASPGDEDPSVKSLADLLDRRDLRRPTEEEMRGVVLWSGRSSPRSIAVSALSPLLVLLVPLLLHNFTDWLPNGNARQASAGLWRLAQAVALPLAIVLMLTAVGHWFARQYVLRERRLEVWTGLFRRQHLVAWLHDLERPVLVRQRLWNVALNVATVEVNSTILPAQRGRRFMGRPGQLRLAGLPLAEAEHIASLIWARALWERRRMVYTFVSSR